ncbi:MAG: AMP-binding protein [Candidatus Rokubacteria bacterium]|nr:AMP-binding protein [Candidatus Rokubacteria bacterium]MBI3106850.1 AMP-binding protein [Candidatus Rokubacteria bacterium]
MIKAATLTELMGQRAAADPETPYFHLFDSPVTYGMLWRESARHAAGLSRAGVERGDKVCLIYPTCAEFFYTFLGALRLGAVPVPLYPTLGVEGTANIFRDSEAKAVATIGWFRRGVEEARAAAGNVRAILEPPDLEADGPVPAMPESSEADTAFIQYTSGSTGHPRGVVLSHANVCRTVEFMAEAAQLTREDVVVSWLPLYHDMGLIGCAFTPPITGSPLYLLPPDLRNPRHWLELITRVRATFTVSPDFGYRNCVRNIHDPSGLDLSSLKQALCGAEPVRLSTIRAFEEKFGVPNLITPAYGLAEATLAVAIWPRGVPLRLDRSGHFMSVGQPCRGVSVRIMQEDRSVAADVEGEICVRSPGVMQGYHNNPEATRQVLSPDGWLRTGDLGFVDDEGYLFITGRLKDLILLGGENIIPGDIEEVVDNVPGVRYSAAVGLESERLGTQRLHVVAEVREGVADRETLSGLVREIVQRVHHARGHRPAKVLLVQSSTIPKTSSGKIQRARLGQMIASNELGDRLLYASGGHRE